MYLIIAQTMLKLILALAIGYGFRKARHFSPEVSKGLSTLIINVTSPLLILHAVSGASNEDRSLVYTVLAFGFVVYLILIVLSNLLVRCFRVPKYRRGAAASMLIFANSSFMALPVCQAFYGDRAVFYISMMMLPFNLYFFTYGLRLLSKDQQTLVEMQTKEPEAWKALHGVNAHGIAKLSQETQVSKGLDFRLFINPGLISALIAFVLFLTQTHLPDLLDASTSFVGNLTMPLSMICIGATMAEYPIVDIFKMRSLYWITALRLFGIAGLVRLSFFFLPSMQSVAGMLTLMFAMPVASMVVMAANEYGGDVEYASASVALTTLLSMLTIPVVALLYAVL